MKLAAASLGIAGKCTAGRAATMRKCSANGARRAARAGRAFKVQSPEERREVSASDFTLSPPLLGPGACRAGGHAARVGCRFADAVARELPGRQRAWSAPCSALCDPGVPPRARQSAGHDVLCGLCPARDIA